MKITEYGPGDHQTWGMFNPLDDMHEVYADKIEEELCDKLHDALDTAGMLELYSDIIDSAAFSSYVANQVAKRREEESELTSSLRYDEMIEQVGV